MRWIPFLAALAGCRFHVSYGISPSDRPVSDPFKMAEVVSRTVCQEILFGYPLGDPYSVAGVLADLGARGPLVRVVIEETAHWYTNLYIRRCLTVTGTRIVPEPASSPAAAAPAPAPASAPAPRPAPAPAPTLAPATVPPVPVAPAPVAPVAPAPVAPAPIPKPPPAPKPPPPPQPGEKVRVTVRSMIGADGAAGSAALRTALEPKYPELERCFSASGQKVTAAVSLRKSGELASVEAGAGTADAQVTACVLRILTATTTGSVPWLTKLEVDVELR